MVTSKKISSVGAALATASFLVACSSGSPGAGTESPHARPDASGSATPMSAPHRPPSPCSGTSGIPDLLRGRPAGTIAVTAAVPDVAPKVTVLEGHEVQAVYALQQVTQVAGAPTASLPREIKALVAATSVPIFLPQGSYLLLVYRDPDTGAWSVLNGLPGEFEIVGTTSAQQRCMVEGIGLQSTQDDVIKASKASPRGPLESLADVIVALKKTLG